MDQRLRKDNELSTKTKQQPMTSTLTYKWIASYFKRCGVTIRVNRLEDGTYLIANSWLMVHVPMHPDLAQFLDGVEGGTDVARVWNQYEHLEVTHQLTVTRDLYEVPGERKKPGTFYRKLVDGQYSTHLDKKFCDMFSPDLGELEGFLFEEIVGGFVRVSAINGHVGYLAPMNPKWSRT